MSSNSERGTKPQNSAQLHSLAVNDLETVVGNNDDLKLCICEGSHPQRCSVRTHCATSPQRISACLFHSSRRSRPPVWCCSRPSFRPLPKTASRQTRSCSVR